MRKLIIVDDEKIIANGLLTGINWQKAGFEVAAVAENGRQALDAIASTNPDVIISDIKMPVMDGLELAKAVQIQYPHIKIIFLSCYNDFYYAQKAIEYGVQNYLLKPVDENELLGLLSKIGKELEFAESRYDHDIFDSLYTLTFKDMLTNYILSILRNDSSDIAYYSSKINRSSGELSESYISVALFALNDFVPDLTAEDIRSVMSDIKSYWSDTDYPVFVFNNYFIVFFHETSDVISSKHKFFLNSFMDSISINKCGQKLRELISIGVGNIYKGFRNSYNSYLDAYKAYQYKFYAGKRKVIEYSDICDRGIELPSSSEIEEIEQDLFSAVFNCDRAVLNKELEKYKKMCLVHDIEKIPVIYFKYAEIYISIHKKLWEKQVPFQLVPPDIFYNKMLERKTLYHLDLYLKSSLEDIISELERLKSDSSKNIVLKIKYYLQKNYINNPSLTELSEVFNLNPSYISSLFKEETGTNISDYILSMRLTEAKSLLKNTDTQIGIISEKLGYNDYRHFCTVFKKETGMSPLQYRMNVVFDKGK